jgi:hypothetical protein
MTGIPLFAERVSCFTKAMLEEKASLLNEEVAFSTGLNEQSGDTLESECRIHVPVVCFRTEGHSY